VKQIINWGIFASGSRTVVIDGEEYLVKIYADMSSPEQSVVEVTRGGRRVLSVTLLAVSRACASKGQEIGLNRLYALMYGNELRTKGFEDAKFTYRTQLVLVSLPVTGTPVYYTMFISDIKPGGVLCPELGRGYGFSYTDGVLTVFKIQKAH
jgi:hypothetical protein